ncbi:hypothetical protein D172_003250 [Pseudoalteromonas sp. Bsw20308]|uniref:retropepsin-like aspartic protease n=1 Tax=Pseudoalteromonas sp. Bsw20308 TaxID=283699 RepID=UPI000519ABFB|nr:retropepsin-like aspartic protease [Pseudoalteromonas sp. Bsw20308]ALQ07158.1 hypothetical protein D172_003250 [Pseudoalteromonas sp. Bsw20308]
MRGSGEKVIIEFEISNTGHQIIECKINGHNLRLILDTGAGSSVLDRAYLTQLEIQEALSQESAAGLGTSEHTVGSINISKIEIEGVFFANPDFISLDLAHVQIAGDEKGIHGLLGSPFFVQYSAIIDFSDNKLLLSNNSSIS